MEDLFKIKKLPKISLLANSNFSLTEKIEIFSEPFKTKSFEVSKSATTAVGVLNSDLEIKKSKISGKGVFASQEIKKGQTIYFLNGELCNLDEIIKRVNEGKEEPSDPLGVGEEEYLDLDEISRTFNHSCNPNAFIRRKNELVALRDIKAEEEITYDYSTTMNDNKEKIISAGRTLWTCKCHCGSENCRGVIDQFKTLPKKVQKFYINNKFMPDFIIKKFG